MLSYRVMLDVPFQLAVFVSGLLAEHRRETRHPGRDPCPDLLEAGGLRAGLVPGPAGHPPAGRRLRDLPGHRLPVQGRGRRGARREGPHLREALDRAAGQGLPTSSWTARSISSDRCADKKTSKKGKEIDKWYSGKAHEPAGNVQALAAPRRRPAVGQRRAAGQHPRPDRGPRAGPAAGPGPYLKDLPFLADSGYEGAGAGVHVPVKKARPRRTRYRHENPQRAAALPALPGRTRLRADVPAVARPAACHGQPRHDRRHRQSRRSSWCNSSTSLGCLGGRRDGVKIPGAAGLRLAGVAGAVWPGWRACAGLRPWRGVGAGGGAWCGRPLTS